MTLPRAFGPCLGGKGAASTDKKKWGASHGLAPQQCQLQRASRKVRLITWQGHRRVVTSSFTHRDYCQRQACPNQSGSAHLILLCSPRGQSQLSRCRQEAKQGHLGTREDHTHSPAQSASWSFYSIQNPHSCRVQGPPEQHANPCIHPHLRLRILALSGVDPQGQLTSEQRA